MFNLIAYPSLKKTGIKQPSAKLNSRVSLLSDGNVSLLWVTRRSVQCSASALPVVDHHPDSGNQSAARHLHSVPSSDHLAFSWGQGGGLEVA